MSVPYKFNFLNFDHAPALDFKPFDAVRPVNFPDSSGLNVEPLQQQGCA